MRPGEHGSHGLQTLIAAILVAGLIFTLSLATFLPANEDSLRVHLGTVRASVAEGLTLTRADDEKRVTRAFYDTELELIRRDVERAAGALASARTEPGLEARFQAAAGLAREAARRLYAVGVPGAPSESVVAALATLAQIQARARDMERSIDSLDADPARPRR